MKYTGARRVVVGAAVAVLVMSGYTGGTVASAAAAGAPPGVLLPNEGERSTTAGFTDWTTDTSTDQKWLLDPCRPTAYPTDAHRIEFRTVGRTGPEIHEARQLAVYRDAGDAAEAVAGFRRVLAACSTGGKAAEGKRWQWTTTEDPALGDEGVIAASTRGGPGFSPTGERIAVTRTGSQVFLAYLSGEFATAQLDGGTRGVRQVARAFVESR